ncbi:MAG TPA: M67 family metallopeptidase [Puia sp.]|jgi:proteasome lid subunit RPN8/RPN11|nr:M67 family metallopeptidase [Puia sp.]
MIIIETRVRQLLTEDALNTFPDECCGFMFGREEHDGTRIVLDILVVDNSKEGDKTRRFEISPQDYMEAERHALIHDWVLLGVYHSHPKHPAIPSEHDRRAAQPFFSYVIISVMEEAGEKTIHLRSWLLNEELQFEEEPILNYQYS